MNQRNEHDSANGQSGWSWPGASLYRSDRAELSSSPHLFFYFQSATYYISRNAPHCKICGKMVEDSRTHFPLQNNADGHLAQPALPERSVDPCFLMEADNLSGLSGATRSCHVTGSLSNQELVGNSTESASSLPTLEDVIFDNSMPLTDTIIPGSNQVVSLSSTFIVRRLLREPRSHSRIRRSKRLWSRHCLGLTTRGF